MRRPFALAATGHVHRNHAVGRRERQGDGVEVARIAADTVNADHHQRIGDVTPFKINDAVKAVR